MRPSKTHLYHIEHIFHVQGFSNKAEQNITIKFKCEYIVINPFAKCFAEAFPL